MAQGKSVPSLLAIAAASLLPLHNIQSAPLYDVTFLGTATHVNGINEGAQVVGATNNETNLREARLWNGSNAGTEGEFLGLIPYDGQYSASRPQTIATAISDNQTVVGNAYFSERTPSGARTRTRTFVWNPASGEIEQLPDLYSANDISDNGIIVGSAGGPYAVALDTRGTTPTTSNLPDSWGGTAQAISTQGKYIAGSSIFNNQYYPAIWDYEIGADPINLGQKSDEVTKGIAYDVNDSGVVVGSASFQPTGQRSAFVWDPESGDLRSLPLPGPLAITDSQAYAVNNSNQIVGTWQSSSETKAFVWNSDANEAFQLDRQLNLSEDDTFFGLELFEANAINDNGQIAVRGLVNGQHAAFLLTPLEGEKITKRFSDFVIAGIDFDKEDYEYTATLDDRTKTVDIVLNVAINWEYEPGEAPLPESVYQELWATGIESVWQGRFEHNGEAYSVRTIVNWVDDPTARLQVTVDAYCTTNNCRSNSRRLIPIDENNAKYPSYSLEDQNLFLAAHEAGHWLGLIDEYLVDYNRKLRAEVVPDWPFIVADGNGGYEKYDVREPWFLGGGFKSWLTQSGAIDARTGEILDGRQYLSALFGQLGILPPSLGCTGEVSAFGSSNGTGLVVDSIMMGPVEINGCENGLLSSLVFAQPYHFDQMIGDWLEGILGNRPVFGYAPGAVGILNIRGFEESPLDNNLVSEPPFFALIFWGILGFLFRNIRDTSRRC
jgi:uncharacterized membrane protein